MAIKHLCDGCGIAVDEPHFRGHVLSRDYCAWCVETADEYLDAIDKLHDETAAKFQNDLAGVRAKFSGMIDMLPDVTAYPDGEPEFEDAANDKTE